ADVLSTVSGPLEVAPLGSEDNFNRVLQYDAAEKSEGFLGYSGAEEFTSGTLFNGGDQGFNLTHIQTYFRADKVSSGTIEVEIRAGGTNIVNAVPLTKTSATFNVTTPDNGHWMTIALDKAQKILPNEDFYVIVTYPIELEHPQGFVKHAPPT